MAQTAPATRTSVRRATGPVLPEELVQWEILVRLPAKALLRCRAVCRSWRRLTSAADFLLAHHRRQTSLPLVEFRGRPNHVTDLAEVALDAFDIRQSPAERRPVLHFNDHNHHGRSYRVHASCDGLLVLSLCRNRYCYICNPTTRQWIWLPNLTGCSVLGLYPHSSSGEYRILYRNNRRQVDRNVLFYVLTVGSSMAPRVIGKSHSSGLWFATDLSILLHRCLHWFRQDGGKVLVFDTVGESFRWMSAPTDENSLAESHLVQMEGTLGIGRIYKDMAMMKLWMLQNYGAEVWLLKYQIEFPLLEMRNISNISNNCYFHGMVLSENGDVLVYCDIIGNPISYLFHCDSNGKLLQKFQWDDVYSRPTRQWFKESLVQHAFFQRKNGRRKRTPCFFRGL